MTPSSSDWVPFAIAPQFVHRVWGFTDLRPWFSVPTEAAQPIGEVWLTGDQCLVASGPHRGQTLAQLFADHPLPLLGSDATQAGSPLLIKLLFAREKLSVQVHPDDAMAHSLGQPRGKTECWYAVHADPGAQVACGLIPGTTRQKIRQAIEDQSLESLLNILDIHTGDMVYVDAGTVHAIWPGSILLETQQNSDTTFRLYDYGRPRELHIEQSLAALRLTTRAGLVAPTPFAETQFAETMSTLAPRSILLKSENFTIERFSISQPLSGSALASATQDPSLGTLAYLFAVAGSGTLNPAASSPGTGSFPSVALPACGLVAIPAASPDFTLSPDTDTPLDLIRITPNQP